MSRSRHTQEPPRWRGALESARTYTHLLLGRDAVRSLWCLKWHASSTARPDDSTPPEPTFAPVRRTRLALAREAPYLPGSPRAGAPQAPKPGRRYPDSRLMRRSSTAAPTLGARGRPTETSPCAPPALATAADRGSDGAHGAPASGRERRPPHVGLARSAIAPYIRRIFYRPRSGFLCRNVMVAVCLDRRRYSCPLMRRVGRTRGCGCPRGLRDLLVAGVVRFRPRHDDIDAEFLSGFLGSPWYLFKPKVLRLGRSPSTLGRRKSGR